MCLPLAYVNPRDMFDTGSTISWSQVELDFLQDSELAQSTRALLSRIQQVFKTQIQPLQKQYKPQLDGIDFTRFLWAWVCVGSRTFGRFLPYPSLVPFADMLNHVNVHTTYRWDGSNAVYFNDSRAPATVGSELCFSCVALALCLLPICAEALTRNAAMDLAATRCCSCTTASPSKTTRTTAWMLKRLCTPTAAASRWTAP